MDRALGSQRPFCFMKHDRTEHRFLPDAAPSDWRGTNVYPHAPGGSSTRTVSEFGARADVEESRPVPPANTLSSTPGPEHARDAPPASANLGQPRPTSANLTVPALLLTQAWGPMDSLPRNDALWDSSGSRATDSLRSGSGATLRNAHTAPGEGLGRAAGGGEGGARRYSTPLGYLRSEGSAAGQGTGLVATPLTEGALQADASGYVLHRNASQLSHIFGPTASLGTEVPRPTLALPTPALPLTLALALIFNPRPDYQPETPTPTLHLPSTSDADADPDPATPTLRPTPSPTEPETPTPPPHHHHHHRARCWSSSRLPRRRAAARGTGAAARHARGTSATSPARAWASSLARPTRSRRSSASRHTFPPTSACRAPPRARRCYRPQSPCRRCAGYPLRPKSGMTGGRRGGRPWAVGGPFNRRCGANERHARCPTVAEERDAGSPNAQ